VRVVVCLHHTTIEARQSQPEKTKGTKMNAFELERRELQRQIDSYLAKPSLTASERKACDLLMSKMANLRSDDERVSKFNSVAGSLGLPKIVRPTEEQRSKEEVRDAFHAYITTGEMRTYSGMNTVTGSSGGFLIPADFQKELFAGIAQYSDLLNEDNVRLIRTKTGSPMTIPGYDLSTISSAIIGQGVDNPPSGNPMTITRNVLSGYSYKVMPIVATVEIEQDSFESIWSILSQAFAVGIARGAGADLVNGNGTTAPQGILTAAANSGVVSTVSGVWSGIDLAAVYASVNRAYRVSPKCAWLMSDTTYQQIVALKDANGRPLLGIRDDEERLFGKKVLVSPDMPSGPSAKSIVFGDLSQYVVKVAGNSLSVRRSFEVPGMAENAVAQYTGYARIDANLIAPNGVKPIVFGTAHV
jgi:HK97 family phage major capsid protein